MTDLASLKGLYWELMNKYYSIVQAYGLEPIPPELSAKATEYMNHAQNLRKKYPNVDTRKGGQETNAKILFPKRAKVQNN